MFLTQQYFIFVYMKLGVAVVAVAFTSAPSLFIFAKETAVIAYDLCFSVSTHYIVVSITTHISRQSMRNPANTHTIFVCVVCE